MLLIASRKGFSKPNVWIPINNTPNLKIATKELVNIKDYEKIEKGCHMFDGWLNRKALNELMPSSFDPWKDLGPRWVRKLSSSKERSDSGPSKGIA